MKTIFVAFVVLSASIMTTGCTESYSSGSGTDVYVHHQPGSAEALQALGELAYQSGGKRVTPQKYNDNMKGLGALGTLMDFAK
jgi:predicted small secreted protein